MCINLKRGGARNAKDRVSHELKLVQTKTAIEACLAAVRAGLLPNRFITISWELGGVDPAESVKATGLFIEMATRWFRSQGYRTAWIWVQECGDVIGAHCHVLLHVPPELDQLFSRRPLKWVKSLLPGKHRAGTLLTKRILNAPRKGDESLAYQPELWGRLHYILKCTPQKYERELGMEWCSPVHWGKRQKVIGKRLGVWQGWRSAEQLGREVKTWRT